jgi:hypothetical protein
LPEKAKIINNDWYQLAFDFSKIILGSLLLFTVVDELREKQQYDAYNA